MNAFTRKASGLVRTVSAWDILIYNLLVMAPTAVYVYGVWASATFPGVYLPTTALIAIPVCAIIGLFYALYSVAMPRSGGDYVWVSRTIHPAIGFMANFFIFIVLLSVAGSYIPWFNQWGLAPMLSFLGYNSLAEAVSSTPALFATAVVYFLICALIVSRGAKATAKALWVFLILVMAGFVTYVGTLLVVGQSQFAANFNALSGMNYNAVIEGAKAATENAVVAFPLSATLSGVIFTIINFLGFNNSVFIAGEVKDVRKAQFLAITGAVVVFGLITWLVYQATYYGMGASFVSSISYSGAVGSGDYTLPFLPFYHFLFQYVTQNPALYCLAVFGWSMMTLVAILTYIFTCVRLVFAWSFDRVVPTMFSNVDKRYGSPYVALILVIILSIVFEALWLFTPVMQYFVYIVTGWFITSAIAAISGIVFPYKRKDIFELSPPIVKKKVGPIYLISLLGIASLAISVWLAYEGMTPAFAGTIDPACLAFTFGVFLVGLGIYFVSWLYHRNKIPLDLSFKEIPPE